MTTSGTGTQLHQSLTVTEESVSVLYACAPLSSSDVTSYLPEDTEDATLLTNLSKVVTEPAGGLCFLVRVCLIAVKLLDSGQQSKPAGLIN